MRQNFPPKANRTDSLRTRLILVRRFINFSHLRTSHLPFDDDSLAVRGKFKKVLHRGNIIVTELNHFKRLKGEKHKAKSL